MRKPIASTIRGLICALVGLASLGMAWSVMVRVSSAVNLCGLPAKGFVLQKLYK